MAIKLNVELDTGMTVENAYARVDSRSGGNKTELLFSLNYYLDKQSFDEGKSFIKQEWHTFVPSVADDAPNDVKQCYSYLKTLPEYEFAADC